MVKIYTHHFFKGGYMDNKLKILLVVSLLLNMFLGGVMVGQSGHFKRPRPGHMMVQSFMKDHDGARRILHKERDAALEMLRAPEFDPHAFEAQIDKISRMQGDMYRDFVCSMADKVRAMPPEKREAFIDKLKHRDFPPHREKRPLKHN